MKNVYFDNSATTKLDPRVFEKMEPYLKEEYGNASSIHFMGEEMASDVEEAREECAGLLGCRAENLYFNSGATEGNNHIIKGYVRANKEKGNHILVSAIEHASVLDAAKDLEKEGFVVEQIPVDENGVLWMEALSDLLKEETILVSVMAVNNEIGVIQNISKIAEIVHEVGAVLHTDAVQAVPYLEIDIKKWDVDFLTLSGHKFYGPKGVGISYIKEGLKVDALLSGGGQEKSVRSGTYNVPGIIGMSEALKLAYAERAEYLAQVRELRDYMWKRIEKEIERVKLNGDFENRTENNLNIRIERVEGEAVLMDLSLNGICVSTGSACSSEKLRVSHVLAALGIPDEYLNSNIRFTLGRFNTKKEVDQVVDKLKETVERLRSFSVIK
jgi:cysteine desulfurase